MNYVTQISQISQMFYSKDSGIKGSILTKTEKTLACAASSASILYGSQANFCVSKLPQLFA